MKTCWRGSLGCALVILLTVLSAATFAADNTYVSFKGGFYFAYPEDWYQVDYNLVDVFLTRNKAERPVMDYEAVFAHTRATPFHAGKYFILTVDTLPEVGKKQIDSVCEILTATFGRGFKYYPVGDLLANLKSGPPSYDPAESLVTIVNQVLDSNRPLKRNIIMMKFFEHGIASFYCYAPDSVFQEAAQTFREIVGTFSTQDLQAVIPKEDVEVADINPPGEPGGGLPTWAYLLIAVAAILVVVTLVRLKKTSH